MASPTPSSSGTAASRAIVIGRGIRTRGSFVVAGADVRSDAPATGPVPGWPAAGRPPGAPGQPRQVIRLLKTASVMRVPWLLVECGDEPCNPYAWIAITHCPVQNALPAARFW